MYNRYYPYQYYRLEKPLPPPVPIIPQVEANSTGIQQKAPKPPKKKFDLKSFKKETCTSLNDVECFLNNFCNALKYIKLINLLK